jgi:hypothetical protein
MLKSGRGTFWILFAALVATAAKLYCALRTYGSEDVLTFFRYGQIIDLAGMERVLTLRTFNHTPLAAEYSTNLVTLLRGNETWFPFFLKLPGILCYLGTVIALIWLNRRLQTIPTYALILFAASPVSFMVDGYHGNIDSVMVFPLVLAACACALPRPSWILCAICLTLAAQVKVAALLLSPVFWFFWMYRGKGWQFLLVTGAAVILGWLPGITANPAAFMTNVLGYGSIWGVWGITRLFHLTGYPEFQQMHWFGLSKSQVLISQVLKLIIIGGVLAIAWRNRKGNAAVLVSTIAFVWMIFFSLSPGMGMQYMVWFAPFLLVWNARWYTALMIVTSLLLFAFYQAASTTFPWYLTESSSVVKYADVLLIPWVAFLACATAFIVQWRKSTPIESVEVSKETSFPAINGAEPVAPVS